MTQIRLIFAAAVFSAATIGPKIACAAPHSTRDAALVRKAAVAGMAEVQFAQLALRKSKTAQVVSFATRMRDDHSKANALLSSIAKAHGFTLPNGESPRIAAEMNRLQSLNGHAFDSRYLTAQLRAHQAAIALFKAEAADGDNRYLVAFAQRTLPTLEQHLFIDRRDVAAVFPHKGLAPLMTPAH